MYKYLGSTAHEPFGSLTDYWPHFNLSADRGQDHEASLRMMCDQSHSRRWLSRSDYSCNSVATKIPQVAGLAPARIARTVA